MTHDDNTPPTSLSLTDALMQMKEEGYPPDGFYMAFFSPEFKTTDDCPTNQLLRKIGLVYDFSDSLRRQVYQMPKGLNIISYEFMWVGDFNNIQPVMEDVDRLINEGFKRMLEEGTLNEPPKGRVQFLRETNQRSSQGT